MSITLSTPAADELDAVVRVLATWQHDGPTVPLHSGDLGWNYRFGAAATAAAVRTWSRGGQLLATGLLDSPDVFRLAVAPDAQQDEELVDALAADLAEPDHGILPPGKAAVEARFGGPFRARLTARGWDPGERWTPLRRDLAAPAETSALRIEETGPEQVADRVAVQRAAFDSSTFTRERWHAMAAGEPFADARCLVGYDDQGAAVAIATVWSAGPGRPGLLEPVGVHHDQRGHGYGTAISVAAAAALRDLGSSSALVCTPAENAAAVATYRAAGFQQLPDVPDLQRSA